MAFYRTPVGALALKQEATEGTAETSALVNTIMIENLRFSSTINMYERNVIVENFGEFTQVAGAKSGSLTFDVCAVGNVTLAALGSAGAEIHFLLLASQMDDTLSASTSASYGFVTTDTATMKSLTMRCHTDGLFWALKGARCESYSINMDKPGDPAKFTFTFIGVFDFEQGEAAVPASTYIAVVPAPWLSAALTVAGVACVVSKFNVTVNMSTVLRQSANSAEGYLSARITKPMISGNINFEPELIATFDPYEKIESATEGAFTTLTGVSTTANKLTMTAPKMQLLNVQHENDGGQLKYNTPFKFNRSVGNDAMVLLWSA